MPKTFTDDIAPVLPSALDGPFLIADPNDHDSYLKIDPATARIEAASDARPVRAVTLSGDRKCGSATFAMIGTALEAREIETGDDGGYFTPPFSLPPEMDVSAASSVKVLLAPADDSSGSGLVVRIELLASFGKHGDTAVTERTVTYDWTVPDNWSTEELCLVTVDDGEGYTFSPDLFEQGDLVGLRIQLARSATEDTFTEDVYLADSVVFQYVAKQF
jgi:hypothetical protein